MANLYDNPTICMFHNASHLKISNVFKMSLIFINDFLSTQPIAHGCGVN
jgi:hypothetical protein